MRNLELKRNVVLMLLTLTLLIISSLSYAQTLEISGIIKGTKEKVIEIECYKWIENKYVYDYTQKVKNKKYQFQLRNNSEFKLVFKTKQETKTLYIDGFKKDRTAIVDVDFTTEGGGILTQSLRGIKVKTGKEFWELEFNRN